MESPTPDDMHIVAAVETLHQGLCMIAGAYHPGGGPNRYSSKHNKTLRELMCVFHFSYEDFELLWYSQTDTFARNSYTYFQNIVCRNGADLDHSDDQERVLDVPDCGIS